jgi:hypothetical protein
MQDGGFTSKSSTSPIENSGISRFFFHTGKTEFHYQGNEITRVID